MVSAAALLAFVISVFAYGAAHVAPRLVAATMFAGAVLLSVALPLATPNFDATVRLHQNAPWIKDSGIHRLLIWRFTADRIAERPLLGWGMDASRELPGGHEDLSKALPGLNFNYSITAISLHPHSAALQWLVELGLPGLCLGLAIIALGLWHAAFRGALSSAERAGALAWAAAGLTVAMLSFGIWQAWWLATLWLTATLYAATVDNEERGKRGPTLPPFRARE
jgi:O-antigen ligase